MSMIDKILTEREVKC